MDYDDILNQTWEDVPEPQLIPNGGWLIAGSTVALVKAKEEGKPHKVLFTYKPKQPVSVPQDLLEDMGDYDFSVNDLTFTIFVEAPSDWDKVRRHLDVHGIQLKGRIVDDKGKLSFAKEFRGAEVIANVDERTYEAQDGVHVQNTLSKFQAVTA